jgi:hypothetical protein
MIPVPPPAMPPKTISSPTMAGELRPGTRATNIPRTKPVKAKCKYFGARRMFTSAFETMGVWLTL